MEATLALAFDDDQTIHLDAGGRIGVPLVGDRMEHRDSDGRLISGKVQRRVFLYEEHAGSVSAFVSRE